MVKITPAIKRRIIQLYKQGWDVSVIRAECSLKMPNLTAQRVTTVLFQYYKKLADDLWRDVIKQVGECEISGKKDVQLEAHHLIDRRILKFRWDWSNGVCLSAWHHKFDTKISAHGSTAASAAFLEWLKKNRPGQYEWFMEHKDDREIMHYTIEDMKQIYDTLEQAKKGGDAYG